MPCEGKRKKKLKRYILLILLVFILNGAFTNIYAESSSEPYQISLQSSESIVPPSLGTLICTATLTARVEDAAGEPVENCEISFSIENPTGGGESISPVVAMTGSFGETTSIFTSGSLCSDELGVTIKAQVVGTTIEDTIAIVIDQIIGSIVIGMSPTITSINNDTAYQLPMSAIVSDINGRPISDVEVSLNIWPIAYATGCWLKKPGSHECRPADCSVNTYTFYENEDANRNLMLDDGEDTGSDPGHGDGLLTPPLSAGGALPASVITDENGVADFNLFYLKTSVAWIEGEITATAMAHGIERQGKLMFIYQWLESEACSLPDSPYNIADAPIPTQERAALIALYNSTDGDNWMDNSGWKTPPLHTDGFAMPGTENDWYGITITSGRVTSIDLHYNHLTGSLPPNLGNLVSLTQLTLSENQLTGTIPPELGDLVNIEYLYLYDNQLSESIPPELGNLANLIALVLECNQLTGSIPAELSNLSSLQILDLVLNQLTGTIPSELGDLDNLIGLTLAANQLTGNIPPELGNLANLQGLYLAFNQLTGTIPPELGDLVNLQYLYLHDNQLRGRISPELGNLANLLYLRLQSNQLTGRIPTELMDLSSLSDLDICNNHLYAKDPHLRDFLDSLQPGWEDCQTPPYGRPMPWIPLLISED